MSKSTKKIRANRPTHKKSLSRSPDSAVASDIRTERVVNPDEIAECAYFLWLDKGKPVQQDLATWCEAEALVRARAGDRQDQVG